MTKLLIIALFIEGCTGGGYAGNQGCTDSPENATALLCVVGLGAWAWKTWRKNEQ